MGKYYTMEHRGTLDEALTTLSEITKNDFDKLVGNGIYNIYGYDERIKAIRYIISDMENSVYLPTWLIERE